MQYDQTKKRRLIIIICVVVFIIIVAIVLAILLKGDPTNQFGKFIKIQNFTQKVEKAPQAIRDASESGLYNVVELNKNGAEFTTSKINDAYIREGSDKRTSSETTGVTNGDYIVDIQSIKQSYRIQYSFAQTETSKDLGGSPVIVTCLPESELIYGTFPCTDLVQKQSSKNDVILQYLPYQNFTFKITPDATKNKDKLTLVTDLTIPEIDLKGNDASKKETVKIYKDEVTKWVRSKGANPDDYNFEYNYDDNGNIIATPPVDYDH